MLGGKRMYQERLAEKRRAAMIGKKRHGRIIVQVDGEVFPVGTGCGCCFTFDSRARWEKYKKEKDKLLTRIDEY